MSKILLVDDEPNLLAALQRALRKQFDIEIAVGGAAGLSVLQKNPGIAVVVSDMRMPEMNGVEFLTKVKTAAPAAVRMMLTGNADQSTAIDAINEGNIFRFLNKPCSPEKLADALNAGIRQHQLIVAERELLEGTLQGCVKVLTEILALAEPKTFDQAEVLRDNLRRLAEAMNVPNIWELEVAAMLSSIGYVTIPPEISLKTRLGRPLSSAEHDLVNRVPAIGGSLLAQIPRLDVVSRIITYQNKRFDGTGFPEDDVAGKNIPLGARMLRVLLDLIEIEAKGKNRASALELLRSRTGWYDPHILEVLSSPLLAATMEPAAIAKSSAQVAFQDLRIGDVLCADVLTREGLLIVVTGNRVTPALLERLRNFSRIAGIKEPLFVETR